MPVAITQRSATRTEADQLKHLCCLTRVCSDVSTQKLSCWYPLNVQFKLPNSTDKSIAELQYEEDYIIKVTLPLDMPDPRLVANPFTWAISFCANSHVISAGKSPEFSGFFGFINIYRWLEPAKQQKPLYYLITYFTDWGLFLSVLMNHFKLLHPLERSTNKQCSDWNYSTWT